MDDSWRFLKPSIRARTPAEVRTVVICESSRLPVREYAGTADFYGSEGAYRKAVTLKAFDATSGERLGEAVLSESDAALKSISSGTYTGDPREVAEFIGRLPEV